MFTPNQMMGAKLYFRKSAWQFIDEVWKTGFV